ncbi:MAG TPA: hypothetical protein VMC07_01990, partial [Candidatus Omnitrophota bacterium]|nr:hypothetical protein [Candidatus Omnitrophota bacterium]
INLIILMTGYLQPRNLLIKEEFLRQCSHFCNQGGYSRLESEMQGIKDRIMGQYGFNGNREYVAKTALDIEKIVFAFLEELSSPLSHEKTKVRIYTWISYYFERQLRERLNTSLQSA